MFNADSYRFRPLPRFGIFRFLVPVCLVLTIQAIVAAQQQDDQSPGAAIARVTADIKYLASDELGGRLPGSPLMVTCENYLIDEYKRIGLKSGVADGSYKQPFEVGESRTVDADNTSLTLTGPNGPLELKLDDDYKPQLNRRDVNVDAGMVFVGYSIRAEEYNYDEYKDLDVKDKVVVMIRLEPQQNDPKSVFAGAETSRYAFLQSKVSAAMEAGAAGIIMVNDSTTAPNAEKDELSDYDMFKDTTARIPFIHMTRSKFDELLKQTPVVRGNGKKLNNLTAIEESIDGSLEPVSQELAGWNAQVKVGFKSKRTVTSNIVGVIEGEGPHADETIVIGAHYDHLGMGQYGSRSGFGEIHNGADDNATGTAGVLELARRFAQSDKKPGRRLVFICFSAEEMGLLGAVHYCENPLFPLEKTVSMINYDMIGWLQDDKELTCFSWETSAAYAPALDKANAAMGDRKLNLIKPNGGFAGSDHLPFLQRQIPVMFLHTGLTSTYHTPEDDFETIDCAGATLVIDFTEHLLVELANTDETPVFNGPKPRVRVNLSALLEDMDDGVKIDSLVEDGLGAKSGLQAGDIITAIDGEKVNRRRKLNLAISAGRGKTLKLTVTRDGNEVEVTVDVPGEE